MGLFFSDERLMDVMEMFKFQLCKCTSLSETFMHYSFKGDHGSLKNVLDV